jgi:hypothetical protein
MTLYFSINRGIYGHVARVRGGGVPSIFISVMNIFHYIRQLDVTEE